MPVKIVSAQSDSAGEITLNEFTLGRQNFDMHYFVLEGAELAQFGGQDFSVPWADIESAVDDYCANYNISVSSVGFRLVHCYDEQDNSLYYRLQLVQLVQQGSSNTYDIVTTNCAWYELKQGIVNPCPDHNTTDAVYMNSFSYKADPGAEVFETLSDAPGTYVHNIVYPWASEIYQMFIDNGSPSGADLHFGAVSYIEGPMASNVMYPHGNVLYLSVNGVPLLDNDTSYIVIYQNKGADNGTLCPPQCGVYIA